MTAVDVSRATVGALLVLPVRECLTLLAVIRDDDPGDPRLRALLKLIRQVVETGRAPDPVTVLAHAQETGALRRGEMTALALLLTELVSVDACPLPAAAGWYAAGLVESAVRRRVTESADRLREVADGSSREALIDVVHAELVDLVDTCERLASPIVLGVTP